MVEQVFYQKLKNDLQHNLSALGKKGQVDIGEVIRHNDVKVTGMVFIREGGNVSPIINLSLMYEDYKNGKPYSTLMLEALTVLKEVPGRTVPGLELGPYEEVKNKLQIRICDPKRNKEWLKGKVCRPIGDLVCTYYAEVAGTEESMIAKTVTHEKLKEWGISEETLFRDAAENHKQMPILMRDVEDMMMEVLFDGGGQNLYHLPREKWRSLDGFVYTVSNESRVYGASVLARDDVLKRLGEMFGANYYVLPGSVHEIIVIPLNRGDLPVRDLSAFVKSVNEDMIKPEERLSDKVLIYDREREKLLDAEQYYLEKLGYTPGRADQRSREKTNDVWSR